MIYTDLAQQFFKKPAPQPLLLDDSDIFQLHSSHSLRRMSSPILMSPFPPFFHRCQAWISFTSQAHPPPRSWRSETYSLMTPFLSSAILMSSFPSFLNRCQAWISFTSQAHPPPRSWRSETRSLMTPFLSSPILMSPFPPLPPPLPSLDQLCKLGTSTSNSLFDDAILEQPNPGESSPPFLPLDQLHNSVLATPEDLHQVLLN